MAGLFCFVSFRFVFPLSGVAEVLNFTAESYDVRPGGGLKLDSFQETIPTITNKSPISATWNRTLFFFQITIQYYELGLRTASPQVPLSRIWEPSVLKLPGEQFRFSIFLVEGGMGAWETLPFPQSRGPEVVPTAPTCISLAKTPTWLVHRQKRLENIKENKWDWWTVNHLFPSALDQPHLGCTFLLTQGLTSFQQLEVRDLRIRWLLHRVQRWVFMTRWSAN